MAMDKLITENRDAILELAKTHGAKHVRIFGSMARGNAGPESDVDILVELEKGRDLFDLGALLMDLQELLHRKVDVVTEQALHQRIRNKVLKESVNL